MRKVMETTVSIIIPVYKVEKYICRCLDSVLGQTFPAWEAILVDDGSPDNCGDICDEYAARDHRFHVLHRENGGLSAARNTGIEWALQHSDSRYLTFLDSDDWLHPQFLEILMRSMEETGAQAAMAARCYTDTYTEEFPFCEDVKTELLDSEELFLRREWDFNFAWGKLYRKDSFRTLRFPEGKIFEDVFTTYQVLFSVEKIALADVGLYYYFYNQEGISHSPWNPRELVIFEGMRQQLAFYEKNGFRRAYEKEHMLYLNHFAYQIARIRENKADYEHNKHYIPGLRREMLRIIRESKGTYNRTNMPQCYAATYPKLTEVKRLTAAAVRTLRTSGLKGITGKIQEVLKR